MGALHFRRDLSCQCSRLGGRNVWVLHDPLSRDLHVVDDAEFAVLQLADGIRTIPEIARECASRFATKFMSPEMLIAFLADAKRRGLVVSSEFRSTAAYDHLGNGKSEHRTKTAWWKNLLAIRLPGVRPDRLLERVTPSLGYVFTLPGLVTYMVLLLVGGLVAITHWYDLVMQVESAIANRGTHTYLQLAIVLSIVKVVHELAHAVACKVYGGECREIGVLLLMGVPSLYCDVTSAWMITGRNKRILISSAGMLAELGLAAIVGCLWLWTKNESLREWCLIVITVCSISTVIVNGNPLMRYDGYFILSDLISIPNLAAKASAAWKQWARGLLWGDNVPAIDERDQRLRHFLAAYAVLSGMYRTFVLMAFCLLVYQLSFGHDIAIIGMVVVLIVAATSLWPAVRDVGAPPKRLFTTIEENGFLLPLIGVTVVLLGLMIPIPQTVVAPMSIQPVDAHSVYSPVAGRRVTSKTPGQFVRAGEALFVLDDIQLRSELLVAQSHYDSLATRVESLASKRAVDPKYSAELLTAQSATHAALERLSVLQNKVNQLTVTAMHDGLIYGPPPKPLHALSIDDRQTWTGDPLDPINDGAWIELGSRLCTIGDPMRREALMFVNERSIAQIKRGQQVQLQLAAASQCKHLGTVISVEATPVIDCPPALVQAGYVVAEVARGATEPGRLQDTLYQVKVELVQSATTLPDRTIGFGRISVASESVLARLYRAFLQTIRV